MDVGNRAVVVDNSVYRRKRGTIYHIHDNGMVRIRLDGHVKPVTLPARSLHDIGRNTDLSPIIYRLECHAHPLGMRPLLPGEHNHWSRGQCAKDGDNGPEFKRQTPTDNQQVVEEVTSSSSATIDESEVASPSIRSSEALPSSLSSAAAVDPWIEASLSLSLSASTTLPVVPVPPTTPIIKL